MEHITEDASGTIEERLLFAFQDDFNDQFPDHGLNPRFRELIGKYFKTSFDVGMTNIVDQLIFFLKERRKFYNTKDINAIINYLSNTDFQYKQIKTTENGRLKEVK